jgi:hypothetical protein
MNPPSANSKSHSLSRALQLREALLLAFCDPLPASYARLLHLSRGEWESLLHWLDTSGLALYFLDRMEELRLADSLPFPVIARLRQNRADNAERIDAMIAESAAIQRKFQEEGVSYSVLKGFSLWPVSVPKLELRSQLDLDFLVTVESAVVARRILEANGYRLHAISGRSWEFKASENQLCSLRDLYKPGLARTAELHLDAVGAPQLSRSHKLDFRGLSMPILSPVDLFLGQGLHLYKHVCSEFSRTAHLVEFRRHVIARHEDDAFWTELREHVADDQGVCLRLGAVTLLISRVMGGFAPEALTCWTVDRLPATAIRWVDLYGHRTVLASFPGSKLYLFLQTELEGAGLSAKRSRRQALLPRRLPPNITHGAPGETTVARFNRYRKQFHFILVRLRFHVFEGLNFFCESILWRQHRNGLSQ